MAGILGKRRLRRTRTIGRRRFAALGTIGFGGLAAALLASTSTGAIAACAPTPTAGDDIVECHDANPTAVQLLGGNDSLTVNDGAIIGDPNNVANVTIIDGGIDNDHIVINGGLIKGNTTGGDGNDRIEINGGILHGSVQGGNNDDTIIVRDGLIAGTNAAHTNGSVNAGAGNDRIIMYGGTVTGEFQNGAGTDFTIIFGGTIMGTVEMQRGAVDSVIVVDGGELLSGFEMQNPNATFGLAVNPTFYLRSGFVGIGQWGNANDSTFIFDPINSLDPDSFNIDAVDLEAEFANAAKNPGDHLLIIGEGEGDDDDDDDGGGESIAFGNGNDTVMFIGARNNGDPELRNLHFGERDEDEEEPPTFDGDGQPATANAFGIPGTPGEEDRFSVAFGSDLLLGDIINFEIFEVVQQSNVVLTGEEYEFEESVTVDGTSQVAFTESEVELETGHLSLGAPDANAPATFNAGDQYTPFAPGGVLQFGLVIEDDDDDDDDDRRFDDDDDVEEVEEAGPGVFAIEVGDDTFENGGTVSTLNNVAGDVLTIAGYYQADFGRIALDAYIGATGSEADKIVFDGEVDGTTTIYVNNVSEAGGEATGNGEEDGVLILESETGEITDGSFQLAENRYTGNREVIAGAYAYRLALFGDSGRLQSEVRGDVAALSAGVTVGLRQGLAGSDTVQKRMGEIRQGDMSAAGSIDEGVWLRGKFSDYFVTARAGTGFDRQSQSVIGGFDSSLDAGRNGRIDLGIFGGYTNTLARFDTTAFGAANVTTIGVRGLAVGGYATWHRLSDIPGAGPYADIVGRVDLLNFGMGALNAPATATSRGTTISASAETGYGFAIANAFVLQPQAQLIYSASRQNAFNDAFGVRVTPGAGTALVGRAGLQAQTSFMTSGGLPISPYLIGNVMSEFMGRTTTNVGGTNFTQDLGGTWFNIGGGISAALTERSKIYASGEYNLGAVRGWGATAGVKIGW